MRADQLCDCGEPIRYAVRVDVSGEDCEVWLDPRPTASGTIWVDWFSNGTPYVRVSDPPAAEPFRYVAHLCARTADPSDDRA